VTDVKKRSTGIAGLDLTLDGGFPTGTRIIVYGSVLSGLENLAYQFWKTDDTGLYLMLDAEPTQGMRDARELSLKELGAAMQGDRVVVDSLSTLIHNYGINAAAEYLTRTTARLTQQGSNVLFLLYRGIHTPVEEVCLMRAADVVIVLRQELHGNEFERTLSVEKIRGMQVPARAVPYNITAKGLELSTTTRVV
jgi:KaiC/GvpD/RAD55 family RecA-like ATPase